MRSRVLHGTITHPGTNRNVRCLTSQNKQTKKKKKKKQAVYRLCYKSRFQPKSGRSDLYTILYEPGQSISYKTACVPSEESAQPAQSKQSSHDTLWVANDLLASSNEQHRP